MQRCLDWERSVDHPDTEADTAVLNKLRGQFNNGQESADANAV